MTITGRPNVGKSTLLNQLVGRKLSITSRKPQTTRNRLLGIMTQGAVQIIYVDTPGLQMRTPRALNRLMNREVLAALRDVDVILFVVEAMRWFDDDTYVLAQLEAMSTSLILVVNKVDRVADRQELLPDLQSKAAAGKFADVVPVSALSGANLEALERCIQTHLPERAHLFPDDQLSDRNERYFAAEFIREKLVRMLGEELPYSTSVVIDEFAEQAAIVRISAIIWVERQGQKPIVIGEKGRTLKRIGELARRDIEHFLGKQVYLRTWVKVKENWADDAALLRQLNLEGSA
ncbi:MAG: GTPase Era [Chromatiales bacterium]